MDVCNHDGVSIEMPEYGAPRVVSAAPTTAFSLALLDGSRPHLVVEGDRITVCGDAVYEVTDWHHRCSETGNTEAAYARLVARTI